MTGAPSFTFNSLRPAHPPPFAFRVDGADDLDAHFNQSKIQRLLEPHLAEHFPDEVVEMIFSPLPKKKNWHR